MSEKAVRPADDNALQELYEQALEAERTLSTAHKQAANNLGAIVAEQVRRVRVASHTSTPVDALPDASRSLPTASSVLVLPHPDRKSAERAEGPLPASVLSLGLLVVAEHPDGHRVVGKVLGYGTNGVILHAEPLHSPFLSYDRGWVVRVAPQPAPPSPALLGGRGKCG